MRTYPVTCNSWVFLFKKIKDLHGLRPFWVVIVVVRHIVCCQRFSGFRADVSCCTTKMHLINTIHTERCGRICLINLIVAEFEWKYRVCVCSLVVVRHIIYCERFSSYRADVSCCTTKMYLISTMQTGRCGRICFFPYCLLLPKLNANIVCMSATLCGAAHYIL